MVLMCQSTVIWKPPGCLKPWMTWRDAVLQYVSSQLNIALSTKPFSRLSWDFFHFDFRLMIFAAFEQSMFTVLSTLSENPTFTFS